MYLVGSDIGAAPAGNGGAMHRTVHHAVGTPGYHFPSFFFLRVMMTAASAGGGCLRHHRPKSSLDVVSETGEGGEV